MAGIRKQLGRDEDISPQLEFPSNEFINPGLLYCFETAALECRWEALYPLDYHSWWCWTISHFESLLSRHIPRLFLHSDARVSGERLREVDPKDKESLQRAFCSYHPSGGNVDRPLAGQGNNWQACRQGPGPNQFWGWVKSCITIKCCKVSAMTMGGVRTVFYQAILERMKQVEGEDRKRKMSEINLILFNW